MKHIVLFSGGATSSLVADIIAKEKSKEDVILLHTPTHAEHPDADRFREAVAQYVGLPIETFGKGKTLWELIEQYQCIPNTNLPFCTLVLKQRTREKFLKQLKEDYILYYGFDIAEYLRAQNIATKAEIKGEKVQFPLIDYRISSATAKKIIQMDWKICLPEPYLYFDHNNCLPCFKGGKNHFYKVLKRYPEYYKKAEEAEIKIGHTVFPDESLKECREKWEKESNLELFEPDEGLPCLCSF